MYQTTPWPAAAPNSASSTIFAFGQLAKLSRIGCLLPFPSDFILRKTGDSFSFSRM